MLPLRNNSYNSETSHTCQELARSLLWWIGFGSLRPFQLAPCTINKCALSHAPERVFGVLKTHVLPNRLLQLLVQIPSPYWAYQTCCLKITATFHLQKDSSGRNINKNFQAISARVILRYWIFNNWAEFKMSPVKADENKWEADYNTGRPMT